MDLENIETDLVVILGPTASGKTQFAVDLAHQLKSEIISADSRQVYKGMNIGTGKDLCEYQRDGVSVPYHLIDICSAGEKYNVARFQIDFVEAFEEIKSHGSLPILCGGTGLYIQSVLSDLWQIQVPINLGLRQVLQEMETSAILNTYSSLLEDYQFSNKKRLIRKVEIETFLKANVRFESIDYKGFSYRIFGLNPAVEVRRERISRRLNQRLENEGLIEEVTRLLEGGLDFETLEYYGLEYKYIAYFLSGKMTLSEMTVKLETEIHRYAKRQMTFYRSMERKGFQINWLPDSLNRQQKVDFILSNLKSEE